MALSYKVFPGTPYYSNTALTSQAGTIVNTTAATYVNTSYGTVSVGGSTYYVAYGQMISFWNSSFTGAQIDDAVSKVRNPDTAPTANSTNLVTSGGVKSALNFAPETGNAGWHNSIYRGKYLGTSVTAAQWAAISAGTFDDLYIGDYWTTTVSIPGVTPFECNWRIAAFDYWLNVGDTGHVCTTHHVVIVPDVSLYNSRPNATAADTTGGYYSSRFHGGASNPGDGLLYAYNAIVSAFGSSHILTVREELTNAVTDGHASGWVWCDSIVEVMSEIMVYGHFAFAVQSGSIGAGYETGADKTQFPLFAMSPTHIISSNAYFLRNVATSIAFSMVDLQGDAGARGAYTLGGVRPVFAICG